jgi:HSP20 family protein
MRRVFSRGGSHKRKGELAKAEPRELSRPATEAPSGLFRLRSEIDRLFDRFFGRERESSFPIGAWAPSVDVTDTEREVVVRAEIPGLSVEDITLSASGNTLILSGEKREEKKEERGASFCSERRYGSFRRSIPLPPGADPAQATAEYDKGVLTVRVSKSEELKPKRIQVSKPAR